MKEESLDKKWFVTVDQRIIVSFLLDAESREAATEEAKKRVVQREESYWRSVPGYAGWMGYPAKTETLSLREKFKEIESFGNKMKERAKSVEYLQNKRMKENEE